MILTQIEFPDWDLKLVHDGNVSGTVCTVGITTKPQRETLTSNCGVSHPFDRYQIILLDDRRGKELHFVERNGKVEGKEGR